MHKTHAHTEIERERGHHTSRYGDAVSLSAAKVRSGGGGVVVAVVLLLLLLLLMMMMMMKVKSFF